MTRSKTLRVIVEIRVPPESSLTEHELVHAVRDTLDDAWPVFQRSTRVNNSPKVKGYSRVQGYETTQLRRRIKQHG